MTDSALSLIDNFEQTLMETRAELRACQTERQPTDDQVFCQRIDRAEGRLSALIEVLRANRTNLRKL